jgi:hypothetical protein
VATLVVSPILIVLRAAVARATLVLLRATLVLLRATFRLFAVLRVFRIAIAL